MTLQVHLSSAAQQDILAAKEWYADQGTSGLSSRFQQELDLVFRRVEGFPDGFPIVHKDVRRANLHRFPYGVFYHRRDDGLYVLAVAHHARHPQVWKQRSP